MTARSGNPGAHLLQGRVLGDAHELLFTDALDRLVGGTRSRERAGVDGGVEMRFQTHEMSLRATSSNPFSCRSASPAPGRPRDTIEA